MPAPSARRPRVLLVYADRVAAEMGGVGIRAYELARALAGEAEVTIAATETDGTLDVPVVEFAPHAPGALAPALARADVVIAQPQWPLLQRRLVRSGARLVFDLYDPEVFGTLEHFGDRRPALRRLMHGFAGDRVLGALRAGHHVICANERQRDLWIGAMLAARLVAPALYDRDPSLRSAIDVVPFGVPAEPARRGVAAGPRELLGLSPEDELVLWNGGLWSWLDAETAIRALAALRERRPRAVLAFMGASQAPPARRAAAAARSLAARLGLLDSGVRFNERWVPYAERAAWLLEADCGVSTHADHVEARFASRTRVLDCFWGGLPVVCTAGDELADRVARDDLGGAVPPGDPHALAVALERVLERGRPAYAERLAAAAADHTWERVAEPLRRWVADARRPPRIGDGAPRPRSGGERARAGAYTAVAATLDRLGVRRLPRLR